MKAVPWVLLAAAIAAGCGRGAESSQTATAPARPTPTFTKDVAPIVFEHCAPCHRQGQATPFTLLSYADLQSRSDKIARVTRDHVMPPWLPAPGPPAFVGERRLRDDQIDTIQRWVSGGAPGGDPGDLRKTPSGAEGRRFGAAG